GNYWKLMRDVVFIAIEMIRERPSTALLSPLLGALPAVLLVNYWVEAAFAEKWYTRVTNQASRPLASAPWTAGEAAV
ncbi:MAG: hypothetical protein WKF37_06300, partial [Bryobacteraceae bacterium]